MKSYTKMYTIQMCICFFIRLYTMYTLTWALVQVAWQGSIQNVHLYAMYSLTRDFQSWARDNFKASRQPQWNNVIEPPEPEKNRKQFRSAWCLDGVATPNKVMLQYQTTLWPENMVSLSRQYCLVPSSGYFNGFVSWSLGTDGVAGITSTSVHLYAMYSLTWDLNGFVSGSLGAGCVAGITSTSVH